MGDCILMRANPDVKVTAYECENRYLIFILFKNDAETVCEFNVELDVISCTDFDTDAKVSYGRSDNHSINIEGKKDALLILLANFVIE